MWYECKYSTPGYPGRQCTIIKWDEARYSSIEDEFRARYPYVTLVSVTSIALD